MIKNLTTWSKLFSIESKYNIDVGEFHQKNNSFYSITIIFLSFPIWLFAPLLALPVIVTLLIISLIINKTLEKTRHSLYGGEYNHFTLDNNGKCTFYNLREFQLDVSSRVGWFGCWLVLVPALKIKQNNPKQYLFLFSSSVSALDYSRISRVIRKIKYLTKSADNKQRY